MQSLQAQNPGSDAGLHLSLARILGPEKLNQLEKLQGTCCLLLGAGCGSLFAKVLLIMRLRKPSIWSLDRFVRL
eukprot:g17806.t1